MARKPGRFPGPPEVSIMKPIRFPRPASWLGVLVGGVLYVASRMFAPEEERGLAATFGAAWESYRQKVMMPWL